MHIQNSDSSLFQTTLNWNSRPKKINWSMPRTTWVSCPEVTTNTTAKTSTAKWWSKIECFRTSAGTTNWSTRTKPWATTSTAQSTTSLWTGWSGMSAGRCKRNTNTEKLSIQSTTRCSTEPIYLYSCGNLWRRGWGRLINLIKCKRWGRLFRGQVKLKLKREWLERWGS